MPELNATQSVPGDRNAVIAELELRFAERQSQADRCQRINKLISNTRLLSFGAFALLLGFSFKGGYSAWWSGIPAVLFVVVLVIHWRTIRKADKAARSVTYYRRCLDRMSHCWIGQGSTGVMHAPDGHLYARDLDIFGDDSLFQYLNSARTQAGEKCLANWLSDPAEIDEIQARQSAVIELLPRIDFREVLSILGDDVQADLHPDVLVNWSERVEPLSSRTARIYRSIAAAISLYTIATLVVWAWLGTPVWPILIGLLSIIGFRTVLRKVPGKLAFDAHVVGRELSLLALVFDRFEQERFSCAKLQTLKQTLNQDNKHASALICKLENLVSRLEWQGNQFFALIALLLFWDLHLGWMIERWRQQTGPKIRIWLDALGQLEALSSLGQYKYENPDYCFPSVVTDRTFQAVALGHPLMANEACVGNDVLPDANSQVWIVSGSNMSGKSTLLRTIGVNTVLALAGAPVSATSLTLSRFHIGASLSVVDDLQSGVSRFYAEITHLSHIVKVPDRGDTLLFLFDEIFNGTNSRDRRVGAEQLLRALVEKGAIGFVTTHDLALTKIEAALPGKVSNVHFQDSFEDGALSFDYTLREGVVEKSNALELMKSVGIPVD